MGTNYYARVDPCICCGRSDIELHIGKSSAGWTFSFYAVEDYDFGKIRSVKEWFKFLNKKNVKIFAGNNEEVSLKWFKELVKSKKNELNKHAEKHPENCFLDPEGHSFDEGEFC